jgi:hypothetical protein
LKGLHPRGEVFGEGGLKRVDVHAAQDSKFKSRLASSSCSCDLQV